MRGLGTALLVCVALVGGGCSALLFWGAFLDFGPYSLGLVLLGLLVLGLSLFLLRTTLAARKKEERTGKRR